MSYDKKRYILAAPQAQTENDLIEKDLNDMTAREYIEQHPEIKDRLKADRAHIPPEGRQDAYMVGRGDGIFIAIYRLIEMGMLKEEDGLRFL